MKLRELTGHLDGLLKNGEFQDASQNGLQVDGAAEVRKVAFAVDACLASFRAAARTGAQMLVVHHGLFWAKPVLPTGAHYRRLKALLDAGMSLYASHLPLDAHPKLGNNAELCRVLGLRKRRAFGGYRGQYIGLGGELPAATTLDRLVTRLQKGTGSMPLRIFRNGPKRVKSIGCISGGAGGMSEDAGKAGFDTYVTGAGGHGDFHPIAEQGVNVIFGGHYATETLGLKALQRHLTKKFKLTTAFVDLPTGM